MVGVEFGPEPSHRQRFRVAGCHISAEARPFVVLHRRNDCWCPSSRRVALKATPEGERLDDLTGCGPCRPVAAQTVALVTDDREVALNGQIVKPLLHHLAHVCIDGIDVRSRTEFRGNVDLRQHLGDDFGGHRRDHAERKRETDRHRQGVRSEQIGQPKCTRYRSAAGREDLVFLPADRDTGTIGTFASIAVVM